MHADPVPTKLPQLRNQMVRGTLKQQTEAIKDDVFINRQFNYCGLFNNSVLLSRSYSCDIDLS